MSAERLLLIGRSPADSCGDPAPPSAPDWVQAEPRAIAAALARARAQPSGGWFVLDASRALGRRARRYVVAGVELVAWRGSDGLAVAPDACPHMGAQLHLGHVDRAGRIVCPWHGLALGERRHGRWCLLPAHDDGVLAWVRLDTHVQPGERPTDTPILPPRPARFLDAVVRVEARCDAEDVLANRLDPWHGTHLHPRAFARLRVLGADDDSITARVVYRVLGRIGIEVDARFHCPDPRTIVMTIVAGEGVGSVVETHATPLEPGRSAIVEATLATTERGALDWMLRGAPVLRRVVAARSRRLWVDDAAYCERRFALGTQVETR